MAIGLGIKACLAGYKVFFTTVPLFITQLKELRSSKSLRGFQSKLEKYDLVIVKKLLAQVIRALIVIDVELLSHHLRLAYCDTAFNEFNI